MNLPDIPTYFKSYVDSTVDLNSTPSIPCPFHGETHGKSFSYSKKLNIWRCFGACHTGGDVIALHQLNKHIKTRSDAKRDLYSMFGITYKDELEQAKEQKQAEPDLELAKRQRFYSAAVKAASTPDDWDELDYILSKYPFDTVELEMFLNSRGVSLG